MSQLFASFQMRQHSLFPVAAATTLAFMMTAAIFLAPDVAGAAEAKSAKSTPNAVHNPAKSQVPAQPQPQPLPQASDGTCGCPNKEKLWVRPKFAELPALAQPVMLDETDEIAALESVQFALSEVGDGASYVWHRNNGRLSGLVQPVGSFKDGRGQVCRHVVVILTAGTNSKKTEGVACRLSTGQWKLEG